MDPTKTFVCLEQLPQGWTKPEPWKKASLEVVLNGHPVKKGKAMNGCDHGHQTPHEVRLLPTGGGGNAILCRPHFLKEIAFRKQRNETLSPEDHFSLPRWEELNVYDPS
jgi:hypothetical protein